MNQVKSKLIRYKRIVLPCPNQKTTSKRKTPTVIKEKNPKKKRTEKRHKKRT